MRVLVLTQYFTPEVGATSTRVHTFARGLAERGHEVEVVAEVPNHPQGRVRPGYGGRIVERRTVDGFTTSYVWVWTKPEKAARDRIAFYASYAAMATVVGSVRRRPDVVVASSPPLPVAAAAAAVARRHRVPWIFDVRDLWPEAAVALGELFPGRLLGAAERLERFLYRDAAAISTVTMPFVDHIARHVARSKVSLLPNGTTPLWLEVGGRPADRRAASLPDHDTFVWAFGGNLGLAQDLKTAIEAAGLLGDGFRLLLLGTGAARSALEAQAAALPPGLVEFRDQVSPDRAAVVLRACDALLVSLAPNPALSAFVPSKLYDFCALARPTIAAVEGETQRMVAPTGAALPVPPGSPVDLADAVRRLRDDPDLRGRLTAAGPVFAARHRRDRYVDEFERLVRTVGASRGRPVAAAPATRP